MTEALPRANPQVTSLLGSQLTWLVAAALLILTAGTTKALWPREDGVTVAGVNFPQAAIQWLGVGEVVLGALLLWGSWLGHRTIVWYAAVAFLIALAVLNFFQSSLFAALEQCQAFNRGTWLLMLYDAGCSRCQDEMAAFLSDDSLPHGVQRGILTRSARYKKLPDHLRAPCYYCDATDSTLLVGLPTSYYFVLENGILKDLSHDRRLLVHKYFGGDLRVYNQ